MIRVKVNKRVCAAWDHVKNLLIQDLSKNTCRKRIKTLFDSGVIECRAISVNLYWTQALPLSNTGFLDMALQSTQPSSNNYYY